ncbi:hypothetical protein [Arthrospiribacter ruber]|uniref:Lipoprotein n=1 Tax=Arthrospiribacter ruber TaxID=2487934 RepID=A0A951IZV2_9BACT|nr:hypothetical protein [Arthrospiribacter ruber]MBW3468946.1 hypothetical protein [Arthrospiribacter ruber]
MKKLACTFTILFIFTSCELVEELLNTSYSTTFKESFDVQIPAGEYTSDSPFLILKEEDIDLTDDDFPQDVRTGVSELLDIQFKSVELLFKGEVASESGKILESEGVISGTILFSNPDDPTQNVEVVVPPVSSLSTEPVSLPLPDNVANSITQLFFGSPRVQFIMNLQYVGPAPFEGEVVMEIPMEISIGLI